MGYPAAVAYLVALIIFLLLLASDWAQAAPAVVPVEDAAPARRIVSLAPNITDALLLLGARDSIVGVVDDHGDDSGHATSLSGLPVVANAGQVSEERLIALHPDVVLVWSDGMPLQRLNRLRRLGLRVVDVNPRQLDDIPAMIQMLGRLAGHQVEGQRQAAGFRTDLDALRQRYRMGRRLRQFYQVWLKPLYSLEGDHLVNQAFAVCGADSIIPSGPVLAPLVSIEYVLRANPDVILVSKDQEPAARDFWRQFSALTAALPGHVVGVDAHDLERPGMAMLTAIKGVCASLAPLRSGRG